MRFTSVPMKRPRPGLKRDIMPSALTVILVENGLPAFGRPDREADGRSLSRKRQLRAPIPVVRPVDAATRKRTFCVVPFESTHRLTAGGATVARLLAHTSLIRSRTP
jgi:hypothetical protein